MVKIFLISLLVFIAIGCNNKISIRYQNLNYTDKFDEISFKELKKDPNRYHEKNIELIGYYKYSFEESALYSSSFSNDSKGAVWISFHKDIPLINSLTGANLYDSYKEFEKISNRRIRVKGKFNVKLKGHLNDYYGELNNVVSIEVFE